MKYGGRAVFRGLGMSPGMIGKTAYRKILNNIGKEVSFRITPATGLSGKTIIGDIFCVQEHNRAMIITIKFQDGFYRFMVAPTSHYRGHSIIGETELSEAISRGNKLMNDFNHDSHSNDWPDKPVIPGTWLR